MELTSKAPAIVGVVVSVYGHVRVTCHKLSHVIPALCDPQLSCMWYSHMLRLVEQQDELDLPVRQQSILLVGSSDTPPTDQWVGHIASCVVNRLRDAMVAAGLFVEEQADSASDCVEVPPLQAVGSRAAYLAAQWAGQGASLPSSSMPPLRCCRRMPLLFTCLSGLAHCACVFPNYSEPLYQLAQFCHRQGLDLVSCTPSCRACPLTLTH